MNPGVLERLSRALEGMPAGMRAHVEQVRESSIEMARLHGLDPARAELAALGHDVCRTVPPDEMLRMARQLGVPIARDEEAAPILLHGPVGAEMLRRRHGVEDEEVLAAIRCHTAGRDDMTALDKVLFLADKLDPVKVRRYPFIGEVARLAREDLDAALLCFTDNQIRAFIEHGEVVPPGMIAARNRALLALRRR